MIKKIMRRLSIMFYGNVNFETHFNVPMKFYKGKLKVTNERIVEIPFVLSEIARHPPGLKILDFGCARSWISLSLASMGHDVFGVDLRPYAFEHPNFTFEKCNILQYRNRAFDYIISLSTWEHVGLGAYGENYDEAAAVAVLEKIRTLLIPKGNLLLTLPVGKPSVDQFEKSFSPMEIKSILQNNGFELEKETYFSREANLYWQPCPEKQIREVDNDIQARSQGGSGVNGVGCFVLRKS